MHALHRVVVDVWKDESGQTLVLAAVCIVVLISMLGLSIDAGLLRYQKRQLQTMADASALAAALEIPACAGTTTCAAMKSAAADALTENGWSSNLLEHCATPSGTKLELTLNNPPCALSTDPNAGNANYVETIVSEPVPTVFARVFGVNTVTVSARAESTFKPQAQCVYFLSQASPQSSLSMTNQNITPSCGFYLGRSYTFSGASSTGGQYTVTGNASSSTGTVSPAPNFNAPIEADPLSSLTAPSYGGCTYTNYVVNTATTLHSGVYCGGLTIAPNSGSSNVAVSFSAGLYIVLGPLTISKATLSGSGVMFYLSQGNGYSYGTSTLSDVSGTLTAQTSGTYQGILYYSDPSLPIGKAQLTFQNWNPNTRMDGILYLPRQELVTSNVTLQGTNYFGVVADYAVMNNTAFNPSANYSSLANGTPFASGKGVALVQ